ncbi:MAG: hypothetical protein ACKO23_07185 [Gemmataceae bacterium]
MKIFTEPPSNEPKEGCTCGDGMDLVADAPIFQSTDSTEDCLIGDVVNPLADMPVEMAEDWEELPLAPKDQENLKSYSRLEEKLRLHVRGIAERINFGLYIHGAGGIGKSHVICDELEKTERSYCVINSHITARGLFDELKEKPDHIFLLEDIEHVFTSKPAVGILRSALWGTKDDSNKMSRYITWVIAQQKVTIDFTGSLIVAANRPLSGSPEVAALSSRFLELEYLPSKEEIQAKMRDISRRGFRSNPVRLNPEKCLEVCEYLIEQTLEIPQHISFRLLENGFRDYYLAEIEGRDDWKNLVSMRLLKTLDSSTSKSSRAEIKEKLKVIVRSILDKEKDKKLQVKLWAEQTGKSQATFYRYKKELEALGGQSPIT